MPISKNWINAAQKAVSTYLTSLSDDPENAAIHWVGGGAVAALEAQLCRHYGKQYALCVSSATMGLWAIALALELQGQEIITTPLTYGASLAGFLLLENHPLFADIDPHTLTLDPMSVQSRITPATRAILAVDMWGHPCDTLALRQIASEYGLWYIADAAQSLGATRGGLPASALADAIVLSFTVGKSVFAGEGGAILTDHADLYQKLVWLTQHPDRQRRDISLLLDNEFALNGRIHPLAATIAQATFDQSLQELQQHQATCLALIDQLNATGSIEPIQFRQQDIQPSFFRLTVARRPGVTESTLQAILAKQGYNVTLSPLTQKLIYQQTAFQVHSFPPNLPCPQAEQQMGVRTWLKI